MRLNNEGSCYSQIWTALSGLDRYRSAWPASAITSHRQPVGLSAGGVSAVFAADGQAQQISSIANDAATLRAADRKTTLAHRTECVRASSRAGRRAGRPRQRAASLRLFARHSFAREKEGGAGRASRRTAGGERAKIGLIFARRAEIRLVSAAAGPVSALASGGARQKPVKSSTSETCENFLETPRKPVKRFYSETCEKNFTGFRAKTCDTILAHPKNL